MQIKRHISVWPLLFLSVGLLLFLCTPAHAITEDEVLAQVDAAGKEAVAGNVLVWFLCAVAFLKVSQKIDSFMQQHTLVFHHFRYSVSDSAKSSKFSAVSALYFCQRSSLQIST